MRTKIKVATVAMTASLCVIGGLVCGAQPKAYAEDVSLDEMKAYLASIQIPEIYLETAKDEIIEQKYYEYQNVDEIIVEEEKSYLNESKPEVEMPLGVITTEELQFNVCKVLQCTYNADCVRYIERIDVIVVYDWKILPRYRKVDAVVVNWDASIFTFKANSFYSCDKRKVGEGSSAYEEKHEFTRPGEIAQGGLGYDIDLGSDAGNCHRIEGAASFSILPTINPMLPADKSMASYRITSINAQYCHNWKMFNATIGFSKDDFSVSFSSTSRTDTTATSNNVYYTYL